jgi:aerobic-type carbon monoxide dehydrogenase small subunit (CoxS/CutS family)
MGETAGKQVTTIEGLEQDGRLHPLQRRSSNWARCSADTALRNDMSGVALLRENPDPSEAEIAEALEVNVCRCGAHPDNCRRSPRGRDYPSGEPL